MDVFYFQFLIERESKGKEGACEREGYMYNWMECSKMIGDVIW